MKVLYYTLPCFADYTLSLVQAARENGIDATCLMDLNTLKGTVIDIKQRKSQKGVYSSDLYEELYCFESYISKKYFYVANYKNGRFQLFDKIKKTIDVFLFIKKHRFDIIQIDHCLDGPTQILYYMFGKKMVFTLHDPSQHTGMEFSSHTHNLLKTAFTHIPKIVIHNNNQKEVFCNHYHISDKRVLVNKMCPYTCLNVFKKNIIKERKENILFFGRISKYKGLEYLCEAMLKVHQEYPTATLTIAGGGELYFDYSKYENLSYIRLQNQFIETSYLVELLQSCSFVVCPYTDATQSGVVMTCNALDVPVIVTNVGGLPEMIDNGRSGLIVPPKDVEALKNAILQLLFDEESTDKMRQYIHEMYEKGERSKSTIISNYLEFYNKTIEY